MPDTSPAFIIDEQALQDSIAVLGYLRQQSDCRVLYSIKALPLTTILKSLQPFVDGFSVSSLFEAKLAHSILSPAQSIHLATPGVREDEVGEIKKICSHISCNSLSQRKAFLTSDLSLGLRINPKQSLVNDARFDPCRLHSKLGIDINKVDADMLQGIEGLHCHNVFSQQDYRALITTMTQLESQLGGYFKQLKWLNLGGGYLFKQIDNHQPFIELVQSLRKKYQLEVYIEPGKAVVNDAVSLVATVIDCFDSDGKRVAVLDTSINHNPEVFEYQRQPDILQNDLQGEQSAILVGSSCLAGDVFGEYQFKQAIQVGDKITFINLGAYTLVKANRFNGYNLPDIYSLKSGELRCIKQYSYQQYQNQWESD